MKCDLPCISENRTAAIGCPVFDNMGVFLCNISAFALGFYGLPTIARCSLPAVRCSLLIANCSSAPKRNSPAQAPGHTVFAIPYAWIGACAGEVLARGGLEGTASPKEAAPPRSFPCGIYLPPGAGGGWGRSRRRRLGGTGLSLRGGFLQGLFQWRDS